MEDKVYFQSSITHDLAADREILKFTRLTNVRQTVLRVIVCVMLCVVVRTTSILETSGTLIFYCGVFIASHFITWLQLRKGSASYKQHLVYNHDVPMTNIVSCTEEGIRCFNPDTGNEHTYQYCHVEQISETKNFFILTCKAKLGLIIDKRNLTGGTKEDLVCFLQERCQAIKKRVHRGTVGKILAVLYVLVLTVVLLIGILRLPLFLHLTDQALGKIPDSASYAEIAAELEDLGITGCSEEMIAYLEQATKDFPSYYQNAGNRTMSLLCCIGGGEYDEITWEWIPSQNGVYWFDAEVFDIEAMYSNFLTGVSALDSDLDFQITREWTENVNWNTGTGDQFVHFFWNGKEYTLHGKLDYDWFDFDVAEDLNEIIQDAGTGKQLYFSVDGGQGILVFYRDAQWAAEFQRKTGIALTTDLNSAW